MSLWPLFWPLGSASHHEFLASPCCVHMSVCRLFFDDMNRKDLWFLFLIFLFNTFISLRKQNISKEYLVIERE